MSTTFPTNAELLAAGQAEITARNGSLTDFRDGSALDAVNGGAVMLAGEVQRWGVKRFKSCFLDTAEGDDLDAWVADRGGPARGEASEAVATLVVTRGAYVGAYSGLTAGSEVYGTAPNGETVTFEVVSNIVLGSGDATASGQIRALASGPAYSVPAATLVNFDGLPAGLTLTQPQRATGGADAELDAEYRDTYRLWVRTLAKGTPDALEYGARLVSGVTYATVDESFIACDDGGYVAIYIGDPDAEGNDDLVAAVLVSLETGGDDGAGFRAAGVRVEVFASERDERSLTIAVKVREGSEISTDDVKAAILAWFDTLKPGATWYLSATEAAVHDIDRVNVLSADVTTPSAREVTPTEVWQALRTAADGSGITVTITEVALGAL